MGDPSLAATVARWDRAAAAYARFVAKWRVFTELADRLLDDVPIGFAGLALDLGAGTGLVSARLVRRFPEARVWLVEPSEAMLALARANLAREGLEERVAGTVRRPAEELGELAPALPRAELVVSSAALHLTDLERVVRAVRAVLRPGGRFLFNLWGHAFDATADPDGWNLWRATLGEALRRHGRSDVELPVRSARAPVARRSLERWSAAAGLRFAGLAVDTIAVPDELALDCAALFDGFLAPLAAAERERVLATARALAPTEARALTMVRVRLDG